MKEQKEFQIVVAQKDLGLPQPNRMNFVRFPTTTNTNFPILPILFKLLHETLQTKICMKNAKHNNAVK